MIEDEERDDLEVTESTPLDNTDSNFEPAEDASVYDVEAELQDSIELDREEVPETDITFECPHCGKYLSIDPRGAGLVISCAACSQPVTVPIPEGMEIDDFDATPEELSIQLLSARQNLAKAQSHADVIEQELDELRIFRESALHQAEEQATMLGHIRVQLSEAARLQADANGIIREVAAMLTASD